MTNIYGELYREQIIECAIKRAIPKWNGHFTICPLNEASESLGMKHRNDAYKFLSGLHCVDMKHIPKELKKRMPELIREALSGKDVTSAVDFVLAAMEATNGK